MAMLWDLWNLSSLTRDRTHISGSESCWLIHCNRITLRLEFRTSKMWSNISLERSLFWSPSLQKVGLKFFDPTSERTWEVTLPHFSMFCAAHSSWSLQIRFLPFCSLLSTPLWYIFHPPGWLHSMRGPTRRSKVKRGEITGIYFLGCLCCVPLLKATA